MDRGKERERQPEEGRAIVRVRGYRDRERVPEGGRDRETVRVRG